MKVIFNKHTLIQVLIIYYWIFAYVFGVLPEFERFSIQYFIIVLPIVFFILFNYKYLIGKQSKRTLVLCLFLMISIIISLLRSDLSTIFSFGLLFSTIIIIQNGKFIINLKLINTLFILSIIVAIFLYHSGLTIYGYLPGQTNYPNVDYHNERWRISLFPLLLESGFFSAIVIFSNYYYSKNLFIKYFFIVLASYFLIFTGIRSTILIALLFVVFNIIRRFKGFTSSKIYYFLNWIFLFLVILTLSSTQIIGYLARNSESKLLNSIILKSKSQNVSTEEISKTQTRAWIWKEHLNIFIQNPIQGIGTFEFDKVVKSSPKGQKGSESPLTGWFARIGISTMLIIIFFATMWNNSIYENNPYGYFITLTILISLLTYGSYFNPYNFIFIILFTTYNSINYQ